MLPFSYYHSPFRVLNSSSSRSNFRPLSHLGLFITPSLSDTEIENILLRRRLSHLQLHDESYPLNPRLYTPSISRSPFALHDDLRLTFTRSDRHTHPQSCRHISLEVLVATSYPNGTLQIRDEFTATIPLPSTIHHVRNHLVRELDTIFQTASISRSPPRRVEIRAYYFARRWEPLALFRDVLELRAERGVEGCVVVVEW